MWLLKFYTLLKLYQNTNTNTVGRQKKETTNKMLTHTLYNILTR